MDGKQLKQFVKLSESKLLDRYLKSRGISPENLTPIQKISYSKSSSFTNWVKLNGARQDVFREDIDQQINEVLSKDASAGDWIHDFINSDNPKFAGKSKETRKKMALAAYYAKQKNESAEDYCPECMQDPCVCGGNHVDEAYNNYNNNRTGFKKKGREDDEYHNGPDPVKHVYKFKVSKDGGEIHHREVTTPLTTRAKHELHHLAVSHLEKQGYKIHESVTEVPELQLSELTTNLLARYKERAHASAKAADAAGNYKKGDKRFKGILKATTKQFDNDLKKHNQYIKPVKEELYDGEKEDKSVATYGKKPKFKTVDPKDSFGDKKPQAAAILSGGKTLTGTTRDTIEIDPVMRLRQGQVDPTKKINKK